MTEVVAHPEGSISPATLLDMQRRWPHTDFCRCGDETLGEHLYSDTENARIHFYPDADTGTIFVQRITTERE